MKAYKEKSLREILKEVKKSGNYEFHSTYTIDQALSTIQAHYKKEIEELKKSKKVAEQGFRDQYDIHLKLHKEIEDLKAHYKARRLSEEEIEKILNEVGGVEYLENSKDEFDKKHGEITRYNNKALAHAIFKTQKEKLSK